MKRLLALILALALLLPVLAFAEEEGEDEEFEIVEITEDEYEVDENGNIIPLTEATFPITPEQLYFRIEVTDEQGRHANTQAYDAETLALANR